MTLYGPDTPSGPVTYGDVYHQNEVEMSTFNFVEADVDHLFSQFEFCEREAIRLAEKTAAAPRLRARHEGVAHF